MPALPMLVATKLVGHGQAEAKAAQEELEASDEKGCPKSVKTQEDVKYTQSEKRAQRREYRRNDGTEKAERKHCLEMSTQELKEKEKTLEDVRAAADKGSATSNCSFFRKKGILYRCWFPRWRIKPMEMLMPCQE